MLRLIWLVTAAAQDTPPTAAGSRAGENAVRQAESAFGQSVGREAIGLYNAGQVRGFSPVAAGNVRIDGLYFDPVWAPSDRISGSTRIHIGPTALDAIHPAPTGLVDFGFRKPEGAAAASTLVGADAWGGASAEIDLATPLSDTLHLGLGTSTFLDSNYNGTRGRYGQVAAILRWTPTPGVELMPFYDTERTFSEEIGPTYLTRDGALPPRLPRRRFIGPGWARNRLDAVNAGLLARWEIGEAWTLRAGLFRSEFDFRRSFSNLLTGVTPDGSARQTIVADPPLLLASTSGELRLSHGWSEGPRRHQLHLSVRGRRAFRRFDGSDARDLGPVDIRTPGSPAQPAFVFGAQQRDRVRQWTPGLAWEVSWANGTAFSAGVQRTDYAKRIGFPGRQTVATDTTAWLYNLNGSLAVSSALSIYGGYVTGLEESGVAPDNAVNRNEALPAIRTRQIEAGLTVAVAPSLKLIVGGFRLTKPYFNLGPDGRFGPLGRTVNQGLELSLSGPISKELSVVAGSVLSRPRVTRAPGIGPRQVGAITLRSEMGLDWRPGFLPGLSLDTTVSHRSAETATVDNRSAIPRRTLINAGGRYAFQLAGREATLRLQVENLFAARGYELAGAGAYDVLFGRYLSGYLTVDF